MMRRVDLLLGSCLKRIGFPVCVACLVLSGAEPLQAQSPEVVLGWNARVLDIVRAESTPPALVARNLAMIHLAANDALAGLTGRWKGFYPLPSSFQSPLNPAQFSDQDLLEGVSSALYHVSIELFPSREYGFREWIHEQGLGSVSEKNSLAWQYGRQIAFQVLEARRDDGATRRVTYIPSREVGHWRRTFPRYRPPELPHWPEVTPFVLSRADQFRAPPPPPLDSEEYAKAVEEVKRLGRFRSLGSEDETSVIAEFWSCFSYTATPSGHWNALWTLLARKKGFGLEEVVRSYALLNVALADAGIACWETKYHYQYWRPLDAIRQADQDGNERTVKEEKWLSLLEAPPHPEYVSGHSSFAGAGSTVLNFILGGDSVELEAPSDTERLPGMVRRYHSLKLCAEEMGRSRIFGGIHYSFSDLEGQRLGSRVAEFIVQHFPDPIRFSIGKPSGQNNP